MRKTGWALGALFALWGMAGCGDDDGSSPDGGEDSGAEDAGEDSAVDGGDDSGTDDGSAGDGGDSSAEDAGDSGAEDGGGAEPAMSLQPRWLRTFGGPGQDAAMGCDVGADGHVYVVGRADEDAEFGDMTPDHVNSHDAFVAHFDADGEYLQLSYYGSTNVDWLEDVRVLDDTVYAVGHFRGVLDWGGGERGTAGDSDAIILALASSDLSYQWDAVGGGDAFGRATALGLGGGALYLTGLIGPTGTFELPGCDPVTNAGGAEDGFAARLDLGDDGDCDWLDTFGTAGEDRGQGVAAPPGTNRRVLVGGRADGQPVGAPTMFEPLLRAYNTSGQVSEDDTFPITPFDATHIGAGGCMAGWSDEAIEFDGETYEVDDRDGFIACVDDEFAPLWIAHVTGEGSERFRTLASDDGLVVGTGRFTRTAKVGDAEFEASGAYDALLAAYDASDGTLRAADVAVTGSGDVLTFGVGIRDGVVCVAGEFTGEIEVGSESAESTALSGDGFVAVYELVED